MFNSRARTAASVNRQTYIPPHIEQAMNQHMQATIPAHLKQYVGGNAGYVPKQAQAEINRYMQKSMPSHLKQYSGAFMQQRVIDPNTARLNPAAAVPVSAHPGTHPPVPDLMRRDHSVAGTAQHWVESDNLPGATPLFQPDQAAGQPASQAAGQPAVTVSPPNPMVQANPPQPDMTQPNPAPLNPAPPNQNYQFIMDREQPAKRSFSLPGGDSKLKRAAIIGGGLIILIILFNIVKGALSHNNFPQYKNLAADQQELIHLSSNAVSGSSNQQNNLSANTQNFAYTVQLSLTSAQAGVITYLQNNHTKINTKVLDSKLSAETDQQLTTAAANSLYDQTFQQIMQAKLQSYVQDLEATYKTTSGTHGKALLSQDYNGAELLLKQLNTPDS